MEELDLYQRIWFPKIISNQKEPRRTNGTCCFEIKFDQKFSKILIGVSLNETVKAPYTIYFLFGF